MGDMQVNCDGVNLDNGSWRLIEDSFGDSIGDDDTRVCAAMFTIEADDAETLQTRKNQTETDFIKANPRVWLTLDDAADSYFGDISPNDGRHTSVKTALDWVGSRAQTGHSLIGMLYVRATRVLPTAGGAAGSGQVTYTGLEGTLKRSITYSQGRVQARAVLATFVTTFNDVANGSYAVASVEDDGSGNAVFVLGSTPVDFEAGMRLKVTAISSGTDYTGVHLITAINTGTNKVTTTTAYVATAVGTAYIGENTTGSENYAAAKSDILTTHLGVESDGSRDSTTGLTLTTDKEEDGDANGNTVSVLLQSSWSEFELTGVNDADRGIDMTIKEIEPEQWDPVLGPPPVILAVTGSAYFDREKLAAGSLTLHKIFRQQVKTQLETRVKSNTGYGTIRLRAMSFDSNPQTSRLMFDLRYQARNTAYIDGSLDEMSQQDDDAIHYKAGEFDYEQRAPGLPPKIVTKTLRKVGFAKSSMTIPAPAAAAGATYREGPVSESYATKTLAGGQQIHIQSKSVAFLRRKYKGGQQGVTLI